MVDKNGKTINLGDTIAYKYPSSESYLVVEEKNGELGVNVGYGFIPLHQTDLDNAEIV